MTTPQGSPKPGRASPRKSPRVPGDDATQSPRENRENPKSPRDQTKSPGDHAKSPRDRTKSPNSPRDPAKSPREKSKSPRRDDTGEGGGKPKKSSAGKSGRKSKKDRSKSPPKSAGTKGGLRASSEAAEAGSNKAGSATLRRVTLRSASIHARGLQTVDMCGQGMTVLQASLFQKKDVGILDLSSNNLRSIPSDIRRLQTLVHLDLSRNGLRCTHAADTAGVPAELALLPALEILCISECNLPFVPPAIWKCKHLKVLDISRNKINLLPPDVGQLEALEHLNAQQTNISTLPPEIAYCQRLEDIYLWGNVIDSLPDTMREMGALKTLAINNRSFTQIVDAYMDKLLRKGQIQSEHIPPVLYEIPSLHVLDLEETKINCLPDRCACRLREFYLANNYFQSIQPMILQLEHLDTLDLSHNIITDLPENIGDLRNLKVLRLNNNAFIHVPESIGELSKLEELGMGGNRIQVLPNSIGQLSALKVLLLEKNELVTIPESMVQLQNLEILDLTSNQIHALPTNFYQMKKLTTAHCYKNFHKHGLWLHLNPLRIPPESVWKTTDPSAIYTYLKKLQIKCTQNLQRQKLVLLGESQSGKTSLLRTMAAGKSNLTSPQDESTEVIDFFAWTTDNLVEFLVHDIGGDDVYYKSTTPLFLDPKALYVLVYDHRRYTPDKHDAALGRWLDMLRTYAPGAVVMIVGTQVDQCASPDFVEKIREQVHHCLHNQLERYESRLQEEMSRIGELLKEAERDGDASQYSVHALKKQKFRLMMIKRAPLKIHGDIALVSSGERVDGIQQLITEIELLGVNKELFPHAQRFVPANWADFRTALKRHRGGGGGVKGGGANGGGVKGGGATGAKGGGANEEAESQGGGAYYVTVEEARGLARKHNIVKETFDDCLRYMKDMGEVLWFEHVPALKHVIFQRPTTLVSILRGIFTHRLSTTLRYDENRVFASRGTISREAFLLARKHLLCAGQLSRNMLLCLWFQLHITNALLHQFLDLLPRLDLCYTVPQPEIPVKRSEFYPMMVVPCYNKDPSPVDLDKIWGDGEGDGGSDGGGDSGGDGGAKGSKELEMTLTFPLLYPEGLFERLSCRLQDQLSSRVDYQDVIFAEFFSGKMMVSRELDPDSYDGIIKIRVRGEDQNFLKNTVAFVYREAGSLLAHCPGLVWYKRCRVVGGDGLTVKDCFPPEVLMSE